jgi:H/ACA ribonucleoprotein complex non-core subunit NAF1
MSSLDCCLPSTLEETQVGETGGVVNESFKETESVSSGSESSSSELESIFKATEQLSHFYIAEDQEDANDAPPKTRNEFLPEELPFIEETFPEITVDYEIRPLGRISTVVESFLVIESFEAEPVLDLGSLVVFEDRKPVGRVFDVFGPVKQPLYSIRLRPTDVELRERYVC